MELPKHEEVTISSPRRLFLYSHTKVGKTSLLAALPNNLIIDTEDGSKFISGIRYNMKEEMAKTGKGPYSLLKELADQIKLEKKFYDYISIDTATGLEEYARGMATYLYKKSNAGKSFEGLDVVSELASGAGLSNSSH
jgi:GTPase SAR1 family protein